MKVIAINGSSRINGNTAELLTQALRGAAEAGADTELIHLRPLNYRGCASCFYCKDKKNPHGIGIAQPSVQPSCTFQHYSPPDEPTHPRRRHNPGPKDTKLP